ncbi:MAG TPA: type II toxin-antitoxin system RelE/ParE family toxin [Anaerolineales bacterium]|nr:type II toxin-antitoxin system RelE/ParE family toxin [Anaerolineales bacterium]
MAKWGVENYLGARGHVPVNDFLDSLPLKDRARVSRTVALLEDYGPGLKMPHARRLQGKVWELRIDGRPNSYRVLYAAAPGRKFVLLHVFAKKTGKTPRREIETAERRLTDYLQERAP